MRHVTTAAFSQCPFNPNCVLTSTGARARGARGVRVPVLERQPVALPRAGLLQQRDLLLRLRHLALQQRSGQLMVLRP